MFWTGENEMSSNRKRSYEQFCQANEKCSVILVKQKDIEALEYLHEGYQYLSPIQKGDYLKGYFMHHYGGGYSDVKGTNISWENYFERFNKNSDLLGIGSAESFGGVAMIESCRLNPKNSVYCRDFTLNENESAWSSRFVKENYNKLICNGAFIFRPKTELTKEWWNGLTEKMDGYLPELKKYPGQWARDAFGHINPETGNKSKYPIPWAVICGNLLHPLSLKYTQRIDKDLVHPDCTNYM
jgi:hypothetical protein